MHFRDLLGISKLGITDKLSRFFRAGKRSVAWHKDWHILIWTEVDHIGLEWTRVDWSRLEQTGADWSGLERTGADWSGPYWAGVDWDRLGVHWGGLLLIRMDDGSLKLNVVIPGFIGMDWERTGVDRGRVN